MKKLIALILAGTMVLATPVMAAENDWDEEDSWEDDGDGEADEENKGSLSPSAPAVSGDSCKPKPDNPTTPESPAPAVEASSVPADIAAAAAAEGKTVGEYMNNAVVTVPGLENVVPIGQGGHVIINGAPSNWVFSVLKPAWADVYFAKGYARALGGRVLNVVRINAGIRGFWTARVNFYMRGIRAGQNIKVFQMVNGQWTELNVAEIREDHVVVDMTSLGTLVFIEMPGK